MMYLPGVTRRDFLKAVALSGTALAPARSIAGETALTRSPYVMNVSETGATILWTTSAALDGSVTIGDDSADAQTVSSIVKEFPASETGLSGAYYQHEATFTNLKSGTTYSYQIRLGGQPVAVPFSGPLRFRTPDSGSFRFLHFADSGSGASCQLQLATQMRNEDVALVLANGDLAYDLATFESIELNYFAVYRDLMARVPFFPTLGNHEYYTDAAKPSLSGRVTPTDGVAPADRGRYYSFDWGNAHFVALDTNLPLTNAAAGQGEMLNFLENTLRNTRKFWRIVFFHHPPYAAGKHQDEPEAALVRRYIVPILEKYGVQLVFSGHEHTYQRTFPLLRDEIVEPDRGGIVYVTSGGGGADPVYYTPNALVAQSHGVNNYVRAEVSGSTITLRVVALGASSETDSIRLAPKPDIEGSAVNAASFTTDLAAGGIVTIRGRNLCHSEFASSSSPVMEAAGVSVSMNGVRIPLLYAGANQLNAQLPFSFTGPATLEVATPNGSSRTNITVAPVAPALFITQNGSRAVASHGTGELVTADSPARELESIRFFLTGLGSIDGVLQAGKLPAAPMRARADVQVMFGDLPVQPAAALLSSNAVGVYEILAQVPRGLRAGLTPVRVIANGLASNVALLAIA